MPRHARPTVYGGWIEPERKRTGYRLRVHRAGNPVDLIGDLKSEWSTSAMIEAKIMLVRLGIELDPGFVDGYTEYWSNRHRKWVVADVIKTGG